MRSGQYLALALLISCELFNENPTKTLQKLKTRQNCELIQPDLLVGVKAVLRCTGKTDLILTSTGQLYEEEISDLNQLVSECDPSKNLIKNGSFEQTSLASGTWEVFDKIEGWEVANDAGIELQAGEFFAGLSPFEGRVKLELDADKVGKYSATDSHIFQEIETLPGQAYFLSMQFSPRQNNKARSNGMEIFWNGSKIATVLADDVGWKHLEFFVVAQNTYSRLEIRAITDDDSVGAFLDDVNLNPFCF